MFDRSACAGTRIATDAHADLAALTMLGTLLRHALNDHFASSNAPFSGASRLSRDQNRGEVYATPDDTDASAPPRAATTRPVRRSIADEDRWHAGMVRTADGSPSSADRSDDTEAQAALTDLMTRLILDHADKNWIGSMTEAGHDL